MQGTGNKFTVFHEFVAKHFDESAIDELRLYIGPQKFIYIALTDGVILAEVFSL